MLCCTTITKLGYRCRCPCHIPSALPVIATSLNVMLNVFFSWRPCPARSSALHGVTSPQPPTRPPVTFSLSSGPQTAHQLPDTTPQQYVPSQHNLAWLGLDLLALTTSCPSLHTQNTARWATADLVASQRVWRQPCRCQVTAVGLGCVACRAAHPGTPWPLVRAHLSACVSDLSPNLPLSAVPPCAGLR